MRSSDTLILTFAFVCGSLLGYSQANGPDVAQIKLQQKKAISIFLSQPDSSIKIAQATLAQSGDDTNLKANGTTFFPKHTGLRPTTA